MLYAQSFRITLASSVLRRRDCMIVGRRRQLKEEEVDKEEKGGRQLRVCECWLVSASCTMGWRLAKGLAKQLNPRIYSLYYSYYFVLGHGPRTWVLQYSSKKKLSSSKASLKCIRLVLLTFCSEELRVLDYHFFFSLPSCFFQLVILP